MRQVCCHLLYNIEKNYLFIRDTPLREKKYRIQVSRDKAQGGKEQVSRRQETCWRWGKILPIDFQWMNTEQGFNTKDFSYFSCSE
jgi:hypothetical protein